jgi:hypothetical protein
MSIHRIVPAAVAAAFALITALPADAKPNAKPPKVKPATAKATTVKTASHGPKTTAKAKPTSLKSHGAQAKAVKPAKTTAKATTAPGKTKTKSSVDLAKGSSQKVKGDKSTRQARNDVTTDPTQDFPNQDFPTTQDNPTQDIPSTPTGSRPLSKAQQQLMKNDNLRAKMAARLGGTIDPVVAAGSFKNLGQFVAAVNVSHNQGIDFKALRQLMSGPEQLSLGQAIQRLKHVDAPTADAAVDTATATADRDIAASADMSTAKQKTKRNRG